MAVDKKGLLGQLKHQETALELTLGMIALVQTPAAMKLLRDQKVFVTDKNITNAPEHGSPGFTFDFVNCEGLAAFCNSRDENPIKEFIKSAFRNLITVSWELVSAYCRDTNQYDKLRAQPWYQFFRIIRNSLSHDFRFNLPKDKATGQPLTGSWRGRAISAADDGKLIPVSFLGWDGLWEMFADLRLFVDKELA